MAKLGTAQDRQALLANQINTAIKQVRPGLRLEIIAYSYTSSPPAVTLDPDIIVDYCPINQSFEKQIYDGASSNNAEYAEEIKFWRKQFAGSIGVYSYYRKYAWRSEPNVIPHYIQKDMQWYSKISLDGISTMAEPGDWFTYELNHYTLGPLSWNPNVSVDSLADKFYKGRYAGAANTAKAAYATLENVVPLYGSIPFTSLKPYKETSQAKKKIEEQMNTIQKESVSITDKTVKTNLLRLFMMFQYVHLDLQIQELKVQSKPKDEIIEKIKELVTFIEKNLNKGLFILTGDDDLARFTKKYGLTNQSLLD
jgi:molybdenum cofactor biosynthesis enzyme